MIRTKSITVIRLVMDIDIAKMCDYQQKQFLKALKTRLDDYRKEYDNGTLKPDATVTVDLPPSH